MMYPDKDAKKPNRIEKIDGPAPGSYNVEESMNKTQWITRKIVLDKSKNTSYIDHVTRLNRHSPGVGTYKEVESAYNKISKSPPSLMRKR
jgi:hypothetical protein